jgi:C_GCAxxG_C_C family probable redox protein
MAQVKGESKERLMGETSNERKAEQAYALAYEYEQKYGSCPQCVLAAVQEVIGLPTDDVFKASYVLSGGGALSTRGTCGALAGALMAVSAEHGRDRASFALGRNRKSLDLARRVYDAFVAEFGSPICADVQVKLFGRSYDLWDPAGFEAFVAAGGHLDKCPKVVGTAARIATEVLLEAQD